MTTDRDEQLAAWLDGALPPEQADAFAQGLADHPELAEQAEIWRANDQQLAAALTGADRPIDAALLERLGLSDKPAASNDNTPWFGLRWPGMRSSGMQWAGAGSAVAAGIAAVLLLGVQPSAPVDPLSGALEQTATLASAHLADGRTITPTLTVRAADGRWCREFRSSDETALACRKDGRWSIEARAHADAAADAGAIAVAGGADPAPLDAAYRRLGASDPLSAADERKLLANRWK
jgi:ferric-dicitrate binding protein FerR (iron transport regulator)